MTAAAPLPQNAVDVRPHAIAGVPSFDAARQELVVAGFRVADVRGDRELHRVLIQAFGGGRAPDASAIFVA
ncbi:MAG TPA: hypothetical protein VK886_16625 [Vicinamibacterales bacterium]|nr:hypothetical protein [Vicinamibacterales bacterium]